MNCLYNSKELNINVCCVDRILKFNTGILPIGWLILIVFWFSFAFLFLLIFGYFFLLLNWKYLSGAANCGFGVFLFVDIFLLVGTVGSGWMAYYLANLVLPYSAEIYIDKKQLLCGNKMWRRKLQFIDKVVLVIEPVYTRGDWGFSLKIVSGSKKYTLLPGVFVGTYSKALSKARKLARDIQDYVQYMRVEESKWWKYH